MQSEGGHGDGDEGRSPPPTSTQMPFSTSPSQQPSGSQPDAAGEETEPTPQRPGGTPVRSADRPKRPCRVPGCDADVTDLKSFNWRYRICEDHRAAPSVVMDGIRMRFCQMCAKFHDLIEFQGRKMSCQKKLEDHNARRRVGGPSRDGPSLGRRSTADSRGYRGMPEPYQSGSYSGDDPLAPYSHLGGGQPLDVVDPLHAALAATLAQTQRSVGGINRGTLPTLGAHSHGHGSLGWTSPGLLGAGAAPQQPSANQLLSAFLQLAHAGRGGEGGGGMPSGQQQYAAGAPPRPQQHLPSLQGTNPLPHLLSSLMALTGSSMEVNQEAGGSLPLPPQQQQQPFHEDTAEIQAAAAAGAEAHNGGAGGGVGVTAEYVPTNRLVRMSIKLFGCEPEDLTAHVRSELDSLLDVAADQLEATGYLRPGCAHVTLDVTVPAGTQAGQQQLGASHAVRAALALLQRSGSYGPFMVQVGSAVGVGARAWPGEEEATATSEGAAAAAPAATSSCSVVMGSGGCEGMVPLLLSVEPRCVVAGGGAVVRLSGRRVSGLTDLPLCRQRGCNVTLDVLGGRHDEECSGEICGGKGEGGPFSLRLSSSPSSTMHPLLDSPKQKRNQEVEEWVDVRPLGLLPGCAEIEVECGGALLSTAVPLLVLPDCQGAEAAAEEVRSGLAEAGWGRDVWEQFLRDVGAVLQWERNSGGGAKDAKLAALAAQLASVCGNAGWVYLSQLLKRA